MELGPFDKGWGVDIRRKVNIDGSDEKFDKNVGLMLVSYGYTDQAGLLNGVGRQ